MMLNKLQFYAGKVIGFITGLFLSGFFTILPIILTIALFNLTFKLLKSWLEPIHSVIQGTLFDIIPHVEFIIAITLIFALGFVLRVFLVRSLVHTAEHLITRLPLIRPIYTGLKQLVSAFSLQDQVSFKKVVIVEFPRAGVYSIGFMTGELPQELMPAQQTRHFNVFVPTTPNPTSGFMVILPEKDITVIDITRQEAMALIISGGIILPERFKK